MTTDPDSTNDAATTETPAFDADALREKYLAERDKRLRADANAQYRELTGELANRLAPQRGGQSKRKPMYLHAHVHGSSYGSAGSTSNARCSRNCRTSSRVRGWFINQVWLASTSA